MKALKEHKFVFRLGNDTLDTVVAMITDLEESLAVIDPDHTVYDIISVRTEEDRSVTYIGLKLTNLAR